MNPEPTRSPSSRLHVLLGVIATVAALWLARDLLMPIAVAALCAFLLTPLVSWLQHRAHLGRTPSVILACTAAFGVLGVVGWMLVQQGLDVTSQLPRYRENIRTRLESLQPTSENPISKAAETIENINQEIEQAKEAEAEATGTKRDTGDPVKVEVVERRSTIGFLTSTAGPLLSPLGTAGLVIVLVIFILLGREDLRDRLIHLLGRQDLHLTTQALEDASQRVSRYLLMQLCVNLIYAVPVAVGLWAIGVPNALLFALLGGALRFVPYLGPVVAAGMPILLSLAVFDDWTRPLMTVGLYVVVETVINNVVEPWLYGSSTGMSSIAVIAAALFWTWLWGPIGLLLATPITATLVAFGKHVPQLEFLNVLLGDEQVVSRPQRLYQRLLAMDAEEATDIAEEALAETESLPQVLDEVVLPALRMAVEDRHAGRLDRERETFVYECVTGIAEVLLERTGKDEPPGETGAPPATVARVLCMPARDDADEVVADVLAGLLARQGIAVETIGIAALVSERVEAVAERGVDVVCISALPPSATAHARHLCKRLRARHPELPIAVGLWTSQVATERARERIGTGGVTIARSLQEAISRLRHLAAQAVVSRETVEERA